MSAPMKRFGLIILGAAMLLLVVAAFTNPILAQQLPETTAPCYPYFSCFAATADHINDDYRTAVRDTATAYVGATQTAIYLNVTGTATLVKYPDVNIHPLLSPTPYPTATATPPEPTFAHYYLYDSLSTVEAGLAQAPSDLTNPGLPVLPGTQGGELFGYIKWVFSTNIAYEVFGQMGAVVVHLAARMTLIVFMTVLPLLIVFATLLFKFAVWIAKTVRHFLPL